MLQPSCPMPTRAYNIEMLQEEGRGGSDSHGWCFGLPPGISPKQWPLDPLTGYPLVHGFTLRLPEDYRCHGPDIAGLSFFAFCMEHSDGGSAPDAAIQAATRRRKMNATGRSGRPLAAAIRGSIA